MTSARELGFDAIRRQGYTAWQIADIEAFAAQYGEGYDHIGDLLADMRVLGYFL